jgi:acetyl esterase/lipase
MLALNDRYEDQGPKSPKWPIERVKQDPTKDIRNCTTHKVVAEHNRRAFARDVLLAVLGASIVIGSAIRVPAQQTPAEWAATAADRYLVFPDQVYGYFSGSAVKLDVWQLQTKESAPTVVYFHGGGWFFGDRTGALPYLMPWLARGWNVINVDYRMSGTALAPAAVEDARCALRWVYRNADHFHLDTNRLVVTGHSAGGHLALMSGMLQESDGLDNNCPADAAMGDRPLKVAAIVDWYGPTDVPDLLGGPDRKTYAVAWLGSLPDKESVARRVSPLTYVRPGLPPVFIVHGDQDPTVPYAQSVRLHEELDREHVPNELFTVKDGKHGLFGAENEIRAYQSMWRFLEFHVPGVSTAAETSR